MSETIRLKMNNTESGRHADFGPIGQYHCLVGHEYDVPVDLAQAWINAGIATEDTISLAVEGELQDDGDDPDDAGLDIPMTEADAEPAEARTNKPKSEEASDGNG